MYKMKDDSKNIKKLKKTLKPKGMIGAIYKAKDMRELQNNILGLPENQKQSDTQSSYDSKKGNFMEDIGKGPLTTTKGVMKQYDIPKEKYKETAKILGDARLNRIKREVEADSSQGELKKKRNRYEARKKALKKLQKGI